MVCSLVKKGLLGAARARGPCSWCSAPRRRVTSRRRSTNSPHRKDSIDPRFEIQRARARSPASSRRSTRTRALARAEVAAERLQKEIGEVTASLTQQR